jgi:hypothetical protein
MHRFCRDARYGKVPELTSAHFADQGNTKCSERYEETNGIEKKRCVPGQPTSPPGPAGTLHAARSGSAPASGFSPGLPQLHQRVGSTSGSRGLSGFGLLSRLADSVDPWPSPSLAPRRPTAAPASCSLHQCQLQRSLLISMVAGWPPSSRTYGPASSNRAGSKADDKTDQAPCTPAKVRSS